MELEQGPSKAVVDSSSLSRGIWCIAYYNWYDI